MRECWANIEWQGRKQLNLMWLTADKNLQQRIQNTRSNFLLLFEFTFNLVHIFRIVIFYNFITKKYYSEQRVLFCLTSDYTSSNSKNLFADRLRRNAEISFLITNLIRFAKSTSVHTSTRLCI